MAMIDYGTILCRDGVIVNAGVSFMDKTDRGCEIPDILYGTYDGKETLYNINEEYFAYAGDLDFMMCFYKTSALVVVRERVKGIVQFGVAGGLCFNKPDTNFYIPTKSPYEKFLNLFGSGVDVTVENIDKELKREKIGISYVNKYYSDRYHVSFDYKGNHYDVYTGYGIDNNISVYNRIKFEHYGYSEAEREVLDRVFGIKS